MDAPGGIGTRILTPAFVSKANGGEMNYITSLQGRRDRASSKEQFPGSEISDPLLQRVVSHLRWLGLLPAVVRYAIATFLVLVSFAVRYALGDLYPGPYLLFIPGVILSSLLFNRKTGIYASILSAFFAVYFFVPPPYSFATIKLHEISAILIFTIVGIFTASVIEALRGMIVTLEQKNREVLEAERKLFHAQKLEAVGQAVSILAHDFRNMLMPITGSVEILKRHRPSTEDREILDVIETVCDDGKKLVDELMIFTRDNKADFQFYDLNQQIEESARIYEKGLSSNIIMELSLEKNLPPVWVDRDFLQRALGNMIANARDAMPDGGTIRLASFRVFDKSRPGGDYVCLAVRDTGTGMTADVKEKIFEPFFTTKPPGRGTGLGLPMVAEFVKQAKAHVTVESEPQRGTDIRIFFPVCSADS